jgi:hypothetical protein
VGVGGCEGYRRRPRAGWFRCTGFVQGSRARRRAFIHFASNQKPRVVFNLQCLSNPPPTADPRRDGSALRVTGQAERTNDDFPSCSAPAPPTPPEPSGSRLCQSNVAPALPSIFCCAAAARRTGRSGHSPAPCPPPAGRTVEECPRSFLGGSSSIHPGSPAAAVVDEAMEETGGRNRAEWILKNVSIRHVTSTSLMTYSKSAF